MEKELKKKILKNWKKNCKNFAKWEKKIFPLCKIFAKFLQILNLDTDFRPREEFVRVSRHQSDEDCFLMNFWNNIIFHKCLVFDLIWTKKLFPTTPHSKSSSIAMASCIRYLCELSTTYLCCTREFWLAEHLPMHFGPDDL